MGQFLINIFGFLYVLSLFILSVATLAFFATIIIHTGIKLFYKVKYDEAFKYNNEKDERVFYAIFTTSIVFTAICILLVLYTSK